MRRIISLAVIFILMLSGTAHADTAINAAGADALKKQVQDDLQWRLDMAKSFGQGLTMDGAIEVAPKGSFYEVKLPRLSLQIGPKGKLDIGTVILNFRPGEKPASWLIQGTLPSPMTYSDATNVPVAKITIGSQRLSATWFPESGAFPHVDSLLQKIRVSGVSQNPITADIGAVKSFIDLKDNGDGTWSGPANFETSALVFTLPGTNPVTFSVGKASSCVTYDRLDMKQAVLMREEAAKALKAAPPQNDKEKREFIAKFLMKSPVSVNGINGTLEVDKVLMHDTGLPQQSRREFSLDRVFLSGATATTPPEKNKVTLKTGFDGLYISFIPAELVDLTPRTMNVEVTLDNLPVKKITDLFSTVLQKSVNATPATPAAQQQAKADAAAAMALLPKILQEAGSSLSVQNTYTKSAAIETKLDGRIDASAASPVGGVGKMILTIKGLDEVAQKMQSSSLKAGADPHALGYLGALVVLQAKGQPDKAADGKSLRNYIFELTPDGKLLLNGQDLNVRPAPAPAPHMPAIHPQPMIPAAPPAEQHATP